VVQSFEDAGFAEDHTLSNLKLFLGALACAFALIAQVLPCFSICPCFIRSPSFAPPLVGPRPPSFSLSPLLLAALCSPRRSRMPPLTAIRNAAPPSVLPVATGTAAISGEPSAAAGLLRPLLFPVLHAPAHHLLLRAGPPLPTRACTARMCAAHMCVCEYDEAMMRGTYSARVMMPYTCARTHMKPIPHA